MLSEEDEEFIRIQSSRQNLIMLREMARDDIRKFWETRDQPAEVARREAEAAARAEKTRLADEAISSITPEQRETLVLATMAKARAIVDLEELLSRLSLNIPENCKSDACDEFLQSVHDEAARRFGGQG